MARRAQGGSFWPTCTLDPSLTHQPTHPLALADDDGEARAWGELLANLREQRDALRARHRSLLKSHHEQFHPVWGQLLKTGYQNSRYAHQMERWVGGWVGG